MLVLLAIALTGMLIYKADSYFAWKRIHKKSEAYHTIQRVRN